MNRKLLWLVLILATWVQADTIEVPTHYPPELKPQSYEARAAHLAAEVLSRHHYRALPLDDAMSEKIFDRYLKTLDSEKLFFSRLDIDRFLGYRASLDDALRSEDLSIPYLMFNLYVQRASERFTYARTLLKQGFDFDQRESIQIQRSKLDWPQDESQVRDLWRKRVKNDWLSLKLGGKDDKGIVELLDKRYENQQKRIRKFKGADAFQLFMNAYTTSIEPHTNYFGLRDAEEFDISMRLSLIGIGAVLTQTDDYTLIRELVPGGPGSRSGQLKVGDRIVGVGQGKDGPILDIMGWRSDDAVALIRGPADTTVRLDILPAEAGVDGKRKIVSLIRKPINLQEQAAKSSIQTITDGTIKRRIGVITLPSFYEDFTAKHAGNRRYRSAAGDVERLLGALKKAGVDGVLMDLRNNGGGSLSEAIELTGLFIGKGPVVQQRNATGKVWVEITDHAAVAWNGPLGVLINRGSASASEIFAAAIQDYGRGVIVGEPSFGKGTVQTVINLDQFAKNSKPQLGELKMTVAQFFRINGKTTQLQGINPDVLLPGYFEGSDFGEASFDNALPSTKISSADYIAVGDVQSAIALLLTRHEARVNADPAFRYLQEDIADFKQQRQKNEVSLNESVRRAERDAREALLAARKATDKRATQVAASTAGADVDAADDGLEFDERSLVKELAHEKSRKDAKDIYLVEAAHIVSDAAGLRESGPRLTGADTQSRSK
jgi:carboxyl-terminal processing protease